MPIYEYKCEECKRRVSIFFLSFSAAESRATSGENQCPRCGSANLARLMSRVHRVRPSAVNGIGGTEDLLDGGDDLFDGLNEDDPREVARWARRMKDSMGDELDVGPEFDHALARIEKGEDPDKVMQDIDLDALGGAGGDDALDEGDFNDC